MSLLVRFRLGLEVLQLMFRASRRLALLSLTPIVAAATAASYLAARHLLQAAVADDRGGMAVAVAVFVVAFLTSAWVGRAARTARLQLGEALTVQFQLRRAAAVLAPTTVEHLEQSALADRLETLRARSFEVNQAPRMYGWLVDSAGGLLVSIVLLFAVEPWLALVVLGGIPATMLNGREQTKLREARATEAERARRGQHLYDVATRPEYADEVRVAGVADELLRRYGEDWRYSDAAQYRAELRAALVSAAGWLAQAGAFALGVVGLVAGVRAGDVAPADLFLALGAMGMVVGQLSQAVGGVTSLGQILVLFAELKELERDLAAATAVSSHDAQVAPSASLDHGIRLDQVSFRYDGATADALSEVSLELTSGSVVALVGDNGAGKSTLVKILFGLYRPTAGVVRVDGQDLASVDRAAWRERTAACFQDHLDLHLVARESIGVGALARIDDHNAIRAAADRATATPVIDGLADGLDTQLGARFGGPDLSGGQWQRLAIARAMMRDDVVLIALDEPSSALDPIAEAEIFRRYREHARALATARSAITLLVSHRFSTVSLADVIVVLEAGRVVEVGSHDELMARRGAYATMYELQAQHYR